MPDVQKSKSRQAPSRTRSAPPSKEQSRLELLTELLALARSVTISVAVLVAITFIGAITVIEYQLDEALIEPIQVPPSLQQYGLTNEVTSKRLLDAIVIIQSKSKTGKGMHEVIPTSQRLEFKIPNSTVSLDSIMEYLRAFLRSPETRISGEVVCDNASCRLDAFRLRLRVFHSQTEPIILPPLGQMDIDKYFLLAAQKTLEAIDPYVVAAYLSDFDQNSATAICLKMIENNHSDKGWAMLLIGLMHRTQALDLQREFKDQEATEQFNEAKKMV